MGEPSKSLESKITTLIHNIYRELYKNSIPTGDWDSLYKKYLGTETFSVPIFLSESFKIPPVTT